jgi:hypothetical protein
LCDGCLATRLHARSTGACVGGRPAPHLKFEPIHFEVATNIRCQARLSCTHASACCTSTNTLAHKQCLLQPTTSGPCSASNNAGRVASDSPSCCSTHNRKPVACPGNWQAALHGRCVHGWHTRQHHVQAHEGHTRSHEPGHQVPGRPAIHTPHCSAPCLLATSRGRMLWYCTIL